MKISISPLILLSVLGLSLVTFGCGNNKRNIVTEEQASFLINPVLLEANFYAGDVLAKMLDKRLPQHASILVANLVDLDNLNSTSALGRVSAQQIASRLTQQGFRVVEVRLGAEMLIEEREGEFMLSRDTSMLLAEQHDASAVLLGTYSDAGDGLFLSVRVVGLERNTILAAHEYFLPLTGEVEHLFYTNGPGERRENFGQSVKKTWERHATRQQAFGSSVAQPSSKPVILPKPKPSSPQVHSTPEAVQPIQPAPLKPAAQGMPFPPPENLPGGRPIDPNAPPTPFPSGKK